MAAADPAALKMMGVPVLVLSLLLTGCGPAGTAAPSTTSATTSTAVPTTTPPATVTASPQPSAAASAWDASGPSFGVDRAEWPDTLDSVRALLTSLPKEVAGQTRDLSVDPRDEGGAGVSYGRVGVVQVQSEEGQSEEGQEGPDKLTTYQLLIAGFGLGAICTEETYRGTAGVPVLRKGEQEGALAEAAPGVQDGSKQAWFSCQPITEDDEWGHAVGWTSGTTAWQLYARDQKAARTLVTALHNAAR